MVYNLAYFKRKSPNENMKRDLELEASFVEKYGSIEPVLNERGRRLWAGAESRAIGYGGDSVVSSATGLSRITIRAGRREIETGVEKLANLFELFVNYKN